MFMFAFICLSIHTYTHANADLVSSYHTPTQFQAAELIYRVDGQASWSMGVSKKLATLFRGPWYKDPGMLGSTWGFACSWKHPHHGTKKTEWRCWLFKPEYSKLQLVSKPQTEVLLNRAPQDMLRTLCLQDPEAGEPRCKQLEICARTNQTRMYAYGSSEYDKTQIPVARNSAERLPESIAIGVDVGVVDRIEPNSSLSRHLSVRCTDSSKGPTNQKCARLKEGLVWNHGFILGVAMRSMADLGSSSSANMKR